MHTLFQSLEFSQSVKSEKRKSQKFHPTFKIGSNAQQANKLPIENFLKEILNPLMDGERTNRQLQTNWPSSRNDWLKFKTTGKQPIIFRGIYGLYLKFCIGKPEDHNMQSAGLDNTKILIVYAQKSPRTLVKPIVSSLFEELYT